MTECKAELQTFYIKAGDRLPAIAVTITDADGNRVDLTGASARFRMRPKGTDGSPTVDAVATITQDDEDATTWGEIVYPWADGDTDDPGRYDGEWEITFASGKQLTAPNPGFTRIIIGAQLA